MRTVEQLRGVEFVVNGNHYPTLATTEDFSEHPAPINVKRQELRQPSNAEVYSCLAWDAMDEEKQVPVVLSMILSSVKMIKRGHGFGTVCQISCWRGPSYEDRPKLFTESINDVYYRARQNLFDSESLEPTLYASATRLAQPELVNQVIGEIRAVVETFAQKDDEPVIWYALDWEYSPPSNDGEMQITFFLQPVAAHAMLATNGTAEY